MSWNRVLMLVLTSALALGSSACLEFGSGGEGFGLGTGFGSLGNPEGDKGPGECDVVMHYAYDIGSAGASNLLSDFLVYNVPAEAKVMESDCAGTDVGDTFDVADATSVERNASAIEFRFGTAPLVFSLDANQESLLDKVNDTCDADTGQGLTAGLDYAWVDDGEDTVYLQYVAHYYDCSEDL